MNDGGSDDDGDDDDDDDDDDDESSVGGDDDDEDDRTSLGDDGDDDDESSVSGDGDESISIYRVSRGILLPQTISDSFKRLKNLLHAWSFSSSVFCDKHHQNLSHHQNKKNLV